MGALRRGGAARRDWPSRRSRPRSWPRWSIRWQTVRQIWQGPPAILLDPPAAAQVDGTGVVTALLLTIAAALAAVGFGGGRTAQAFPVVLPGLATTLLIAPIALACPGPPSPWPRSPSSRCACWASP